MNLFERHQQLGAHFIERDGVPIPRDYGDVRGEYDALHSGAGLIDLANFGILRVEGRDRAAWLHKLVTANIEALSEGQGTYSLLLNAKGHVVADFVVLVQADALLLYTSLRAKEKLFSNLRRAIFREKVALADAGDSFAILSLQGEQSHAVLNKLHQSKIPSIAVLGFSMIKFNDANVCVVHHPRAGTDGFDLIVPREHALALWDALIANGARPVGFDAMNVARVEAGIAWYGDDFDEAMLAPEARLEPFIAESKGCYTGQEVIARIKNRGHVNRLLTQFQIEGDVVPQRGDLIVVGDKEVGWITSAVMSFEKNAPLTLGYLRREMWQDGASAQVLRGEAKLNATVRTL